MWDVQREGSDLLIPGATTMGVAVWQVWSSVQGSEGFEN